MLSENLEDKKLRSSTTLMISGANHYDVPKLAVNMEREDRLDVAGLLEYEAEVISKLGTKASFMGN